jgi:CRISPR-associated protein Cmr2
MTHLHFTFGPVQSFVAQARRTRDLYAGSFLLSHLSLAAMAAAEAVGGKVILPDYSALKKQQSEHATAPNRFIAEFATEEVAAEAGRLACKSLENEWKRIAEVIWKCFLDAIASQESETRRIWNRQISNFWEIAWAVGGESDNDLLDRRKNWHTPSATTEGGDHCTLMSQWQELSGFIRQKGDRQRGFWEAVRKQPTMKKLDLESDERLCAIAFVKRFFPLVSQQTIGRELDMRSWPSTVLVAAVPWMRKVKCTPSAHQAAAAYTELARHEPGSILNSARRLAALENFPPAAGDFALLSGNFLNPTALKNERGTPLTVEDKDRRTRLCDELHKPEEATDDHAGNFYALLLMDGDSMGALIGKHTAGVITPCLTKFAANVPQLIENERHSGVCIYAGGDDVLAMLPLDHALEAVAAVRKLYRNSFSEMNISATISAGLVFAHYRCAFSRVLKCAHEMLDEVAKEGADKDALAIGVLKPGGKTCQWVAKFGDFIDGGANCFAPLVEAFAAQRRSENDGLSASFLYNLRDRFGKLFENADTPDAPRSHPFDIETLEKFFIAEYLNGRREKNDAANEQRQFGEAKQLMQQLLKVCHQPEACQPGGKRLNFDGARLVKFLALDGKEGAK